MNLEALFGETLFIWVILPLLIFLAGVAYVTLGTLRIIFISRGHSFISPLLGFFEVIIWLVAISQIIGKVTSVAAYFAYAAGYAAGNYVGILIEEKMALGIMLVRVILTKDDNALSEHLAKEGFGVTTVDAKGMYGQVKLVFTIVRRKDLEKVAAIIKKIQPNAFYSIEEARRAVEGVFPKHNLRR